MKPLSTLLFAIFLCLCSLSHAQSFEFGLGTEWTYCQTRFSPPSNTLKTIQITGDTLINGEQAFIIEGDCTCGDIAPRYIRKEEEKIYYYKDEVKYLLYDFSLQAGDTLKVIRNEFDTIYVGIDSVGIINFNGEDKIIQYINTIASENNNHWAEWGETFIEDFGSTRCFFPMNPVCDPGTGPLLSIEVQDFPIVEFDFECITLSTSELAKVNIRTYPNPAKDQFIIEYSGVNEKIHLTFYNMMGAVILNEVLNPGEFLTTNVSGWIPGMYIMQATSGQKSASTRLIVGQ